MQKINIKKKFKIIGKIQKIYKKCDFWTFQGRKNIIFFSLSYLNINYIGYPFATH